MSDTLKKTRKLKMKVVLFQKNKYGKYFISDYESNIEFTHTTAYHMATVFDTVSQKDEIKYLKNTFGFQYKSSKFSDIDFEASKSLNRVYVE
jgi:hypothetical protein